MGIAVSRRTCFVVHTPHRCMAVGAQCAVHCVKHPSSVRGYVHRPSRVGRGRQGTRSRSRSSLFGRRGPASMSNAPCAVLSMLHASAVGLRVPGGKQLACKPCRIGGLGCSMRHATNAGTLLLHQSSVRAFRMRFFRPHAVAHCRGYVQRMRGSFGTWVQGPLPAFGCQRSGRIAWEESCGGWILLVPMVSCAHVPHPKRQDSDLQRRRACFPGTSDPGLQCAP